MKMAKIGLDNCLQTARALSPVVKGSNSAIGWIAFKDLSFCPLSYDAMKFKKESYPPSFVIFSSVLSVNYMHNIGQAFFCYIMRNWFIEFLYIWSFILLLMQWNRTIFWKKWSENKNKTFELVFLPVHIFFS